MSASAAAKMGPARSTFGLRALVDNTNPLYVQDDTPNLVTHYRAGFWLNPNTFDPGEAQSHFRTRLFIAFTASPQRRVAAIVLKRQSNVYQILGRARNDDNSQTDTSFSRSPARRRTTSSSI